MKGFLAKVFAGLIKPAVKFLVDVTIAAVKTCVQMIAASFQVAIVSVLMKDSKEFLRNKGQEIGTKIAGWAANKRYEERLAGGLDLPTNENEYFGIRDEDEDLDIPDYVFAL